MEFLLSDFSTSSQLNFSRVIPFKDYSSAMKIPNINTSMSVNLFIVGMRYLGNNVSLKIGNEKYDQNSS